MKITRYFINEEGERTGDVGLIPLWIPKSADFDPAFGVRGLLHDTLEHQLCDRGRVHEEAMAFGRLLALRTMPGNGDRTDSTSMGVEFAGLIGDAQWQLTYDEILPRPPKMGRLFDSDVRKQIERLVGSCYHSLRRDLRDHENMEMPSEEFFTRLAHWLGLGYIDAHRRYGGYRGCTEVGSIFDWGGTDDAKRSLQRAMADLEVGDCVRLTIDTDEYGARFTPLHMNYETGDHPHWLRQRVRTWRRS